MAGHPFVEWRTYRDELGQLVIECACSRCGDRWRRICQRPDGIAHHVGRYMVVHAHGARPLGCA